MGTILSIVERGKKMISRYYLKSIHLLEFLMIFKCVNIFIPKVRILYIVDFFIYCQQFQC
jgi:hypothetical protein